jgi:hypothetical protein
MKEVTRVYLRCVVIELWDIIIYIVAIYKIYISVKTLKTFKTML